MFHVIVVLTHGTLASPNLHVILSWMGLVYVPKQISRYESAGAASNFLATWWNPSVDGPESLEQLLLRLQELTGGGDAVDVLSIRSGIDRFSQPGETTCCVESSDEFDRRRWSADSFSSEKDIYPPEVEAVGGWTGDSGAHSELRKLLSPVTRAVESTAEGKNRPRARYACIVCSVVGPCN